MSYDRFVDEPLTSRDALNKFQIKIKILDLDDARDFSPRYGRRVLVKRILLTIKHILTEEIEEKELDVEELEKRMRNERLRIIARVYLLSIVNPTRQAVNDDVGKCERRLD